MKRNNLYKIKNSGWHFSYLGGVDKIEKKLKTFRILSSIMKNIIIKKTLKKQSMMAMICS